MASKVQALFEFYLAVGYPVTGVTRAGGIGRGFCFALGCCLVGALYCSEAGGYPGFAGGDGLAVLLAVGAIGEAVTELLNFADVGFAFSGVGGEGVHGDVGGGLVKDEAHRAAARVAFGAGDDRGAFGLGSGLGGWDDAILDAVTRQAASRLIDTLVVRGYLTREVNPADRRRLNIELTGRGRAAAEVIAAAIRQVDEDYAVEGPAQAA